jgi:hypothetical protein
MRTKILTLVTVGLLVHLLLSIISIRTLAITAPPGMDGLFFAKAWEGSGIIIPDFAMHPANPNIPARLYVILPSGIKCPVEFVRKIETKVIPLGPDSHATREGGWAYAFKKGICGEFPFVLASEDFLKQHVPVAVSKGTMKPLNKEDVSRIEKTKKRMVYKSWNIANTENGIKFALVQFVNPEKVPSSCLVLIAKDRLVFEDFGEDYGAIVIDDDQTRPNAGDDDIDSPDIVEIINVFKSSSGLEIVRMLQGHEGTNTDLMRENGSAFKTIQGNYFYWGPNF